MCNVRDDHIVIIGGGPLVNKLSCKKHSKLQAHSSNGTTVGNVEFSFADNISPKA